jgi:DNA-binding transcriptional LysR family regulator
MTLLEREDGSSSREVTERELARLGVRWAGVWQAGSSEAIKRAARAGLGVGFVSEWTLVDELARDELAVFRLAGTPPFLSHLSIAHLASASLSPAEQQLAGKLRMIGEPLRAA